MGGGSPGLCSNKVLCFEPFQRLQKFKALVGPPQEAWHKNTNLFHWIFNNTIVVMLIVSCVHPKLRKRWKDA